uniref:Cationic amino acid transporter C-terminal domain-containing protein n=1 Tax=Aegilops tauschii subsp. strangulata TaxID=200361 RepID=A0A453CJZ3_AEGTS
MALRDVLLSVAQTPHRLRRRALVTWTPAQELNEVRDRSGARMARRLEWYDLVGLGVGGMLGAGVFVTTGRVARDTAGPAVFASYVVAGVSALLSSFCYAEFAVRVPVAGGAFSYLRVTFGEFVGFFGGANILMEYVLSNAAVARSFTDYLASTCGVTEPNAWRVEVEAIAKGYNALDFPAVALILLLTACLCYRYIPTHFIDAYAFYKRVAIGLAEGQHQGELDAQHGAHGVPPALLRLHHRGRLLERQRAQHGDARRAGALRRPGSPRRRGRRLLQLHRLRLGVHHGRGDPGPRPRAARRHRRLRAHRLRALLPHVRRALRHAALHRDHRERALLFGVQGQGRVEVGEQRRRGRRQHRHRGVAAGGHAGAGEVPVRHRQSEAGAGMAGQGPPFHRLRLCPYISRALHGINRALH